MRTLTLYVLVMFFCQSAMALEGSGVVNFEARVFADDPIDPNQHNNNTSMSYEPEFYHEWNDGTDSATFTFFGRYDQGDRERSHVDVRELQWTHVADAWESRIGIGKVFWGVTESVHLVDIINQTDLVENADGEDKLGQPMINFTFINDWGTVDTFLMPGFRDRKFPGIEGRLRTIPYVDTSKAIYESSDEDDHIDVAVRWAHTLGDWDVGLSHFRGTSRDPSFVPIGTGPTTVLAPYYAQIDQTGLDLQATKGSWLWKLEAIHRRFSDKADQDSYSAAAAGFEYTFFGIFESAADLGVIGEYLYDDREKTLAGPFDNDFFVGARLALNDVQSTELLAGFIDDLDNGNRLYSVEASRRLGESLKLSIEYRATSGVTSEDALYSLRNDDLLQLELSYYF